MNSAAVTATSRLPAAGGQVRQPNELDLRRIVRLLKKRARYLYVSPQVEPFENGYRIQSPCCSRKIDATGGMVDIARLEYDGLLDAWKLFRKIHAEQRWEFYLVTERLDEVIDYLNRDPARLFWQ